VLPQAAKRRSRGCHAVLYGGSGPGAGAKHKATTKTQKANTTMKTILHASLTLTAITLALCPSIGLAQGVFTGDNSNNFFQQASGDPSVRGATFNFFGGNDRLILLRNDDLAGLNDGVANMGAGRDVVITSFEMSGTFNLDGGNDFFASAGSIFGPSFNRITVFGGAGNDLIVVSTENCVYQGELGNDIFVSDGANNTFDGGVGNDTYSAEAADSAASIDLAAGTAFARFNLESDVFTNIENVRGSQSDDRIFGDSGNNRIDGLAGNDAIDGDPGNDTISGGAGTNELFGNAGIDTLVVEGNVSSKTRIPPDAIRVIGTLDGVAFDHIASGFEQVLENNKLKSVASFMEETDTVGVLQPHIAESPVLAAIDGFVAGLTLNGTASANTLNGSAGHDDIAGLGGNDTLNGNGGDDEIFGGEGADTINGGLGVDKLTGGASNDTFVFSTALAGGADTITDYNVAQDTIRIKSNLVGNLPAGSLAAIRFKNTAQGAIDADDRIIYNKANGQLIFDSNGSGALGSVLIAKLPANLAMVASEIVIVP
jgi:serralysin